MQYRGASLEVIQLSDFVTVSSIPFDQELVVAIATVEDHTIGLPGVMPVNVIKTDVYIDTETHRQPGISGSAIIDNKTISFVNINEIVNFKHPEWNIS